MNSKDNTTSSVSHEQSSPMVSVILPTYNRAQLIGRSIQSVLSQSFKDFEVIVVDDGSTDDTTKIVKEFRDVRLRYIRLERNMGAGSARNIGIQESRGDYVAFQDSDDEWFPHKLEKHINIFMTQNANIGIVYSDMQMILRDGSSQYHKSPVIKLGRIIDPITNFYQVYMLGIQSTVIKRQCFDKAGSFNEEIICLQDMELFIRLAMDYDFYHIKEPLVKYYKTDGLTSHLLYQHHDRRRILKLHYKNLKLHKRFMMGEYMKVTKETISRTSSLALKRIVKKLTLRAMFVRNVPLDGIDPDLSALTNVDES